MAQDFDPVTMAEKQERRVLRNAEALYLVYCEFADDPKVFEIIGEDFGAFIDSVSDWRKANGKEVP